MAAAPPNTLVHPFTPEPRSSLNSSQPQKRPTRLLVFHSGKAMESPTLRIANTLKAYQAKYNDYPRLGSIFGYQTIKAAAAILAKAGSTDPEKLIAATEGLSVPSP